MRRPPARKIEQHLVNIAPTPPFRRIIGLDDRMLGGAKMLGRVLVGRLVAATDVTTGAADAQMQPEITRFQALFTSGSARHDLADTCDVFALWGHASPHPV